MDSYRFFRSQDISANFALKLARTEVWLQKEITKNNMRIRWVDDDDFDVQNFSDDESLCELAYRRLEAGNWLAMGICIDIRTPYLGKNFSILKHRLESNYLENGWYNAESLWGIVYAVEEETATQRIFEAEVGLEVKRLAEKGYYDDWI